VPVTGFPIRATGGHNLPLYHSPQLSRVERIINQFRSLHDCCGMWCSWKREQLNWNLRRGVKSRFVVKSIALPKKG
jgi:hypothetical protein